MICPKCSQAQVSEEVRFCPRCGEALKSQGEGAAGGGLTPRQRGVRQGVVLMLLSVVLIPAHVLLAALFPAEDRLVESSPSDTPFEKISQAVLVTLFLLGLARVLYARLFERAAGRLEEGGDEGRVGELKGSAEGRALPPQGTPAEGFGAWRVNTDELAAQPRRGAERTTRSLGRE